MEREVREAGSALVEFKDVSLGYDGTPVLDSLNFAIRRGDFVGIVGPNGVGKTTLVRGILGVLRPLSGTVRYQDGNRDSIRFGYVPQRQALDEAYPLSVLDVVVMGRCSLVGFGRRPTRADRQRALRALEETGLRELADSLYRDLSGGQKQRALIARALAGEPDVLVLDEPTTDLDLAGQRSTMDLLARLHEECGMTVIVVSHLLHHVINYAKTIAFVESDVVRFQSADDAVTAANLSALYGIDVYVGEIEGHRFVL